MSTKLFDIGTNPKMVVDAIGSLGVGGLIVLTPDASTGTSLYGTLRQNGFAYQVSAGKTLYIAAGLLNPTGANANFTHLGYGTGIVSNSVSAPPGQAAVTGSITVAAVGAVLVPIWAKFPASSYPYILNGTVLMSATFWCFEE